MASNPLFIICSMYQTFFCIFQTNLDMATLGLKEMGKFLWEGREKSLPSWMSQCSFAFGKCTEKPGIPFWGRTQCLFPSKTCC